MLAQEWLGWPFRCRAALTAVWLLAAVFFVIAGLEHEHNVSSLAEEVEAGRQRKYRVAEGFIYKSMLAKDRLKSGWEFSIYLYVQETNRLEPIWPQDAAVPYDVRVFQPGKGATGIAWQEPGDVIVKYGEEVHNATHGLTVEQQEAFRDYHAVVATAIHSDREVPIGVLSGICKDEDTCFDEQADQALLLTAAEVIGVVMSRLRL